MSMSVNIAGRTYPLKVKEEDTQSIQSVVNELNEKIKDFQLTYINKDKQDCLAMALLTYAVDLYKVRYEHAEDHKLSNRLREIEHMIDQVMS